MRALRNTNCVEQTHRLFVRCTARGACSQLRQDDVFQSAELWQQVVKLVNEPNLVAPHHGAGAVRLARCILSCDFDRSSVRCVQQTCDVQQGRLART